MARSQLRWVDRLGGELGYVGEPGGYENPVLSPDEGRIAVERDGDIHILDLTRGGTDERFTFDAAPEGHPVWSPDGQLIIYGVERDGPTDLYEKAAGGASPERLLLESDVRLIPTDWSSDGEFLAYSVFPALSFSDLWLMPMSKDQPASAFFETPFSETFGVFSPNGRWLAYQSNESGDAQVYVQSVPPSGDKEQVSTQGGRGPQWRGDGRELYYVAPGDNLMAVDIDTEGNALDVGLPQTLFQVPFRRNRGTTQRNVFDVTADGQRFLVNTRIDEVNVTTPATVILNWSAGLEP